MADYQESHIKKQEVKQPEGDQKLSRIPFTQYIDLGTKDNPNIENQLRVLYHTVKQLQTIKNRIEHVD